MKSKIALLFFLVFFIFSGFSSAETYSNSQYNIILEIPLGWKSVTPPDDSFLVMETGNPKYMALFITAKFIDVGPNTTYASITSPTNQNEILKAADGKFKRLHPNETLFSSNFEKIGPNTFVVQKGSYTLKDNTPMKQVTATFVKNRIRYEITLYTSDISENFDLPFYEVAKTIRPLR